MPFDGNPVEFETRVVPQVRLDPVTKALIAAKNEVVTKGWGRGGNGAGGWDGVCILKAISNITGVGLYDRDSREAVRVYHWNDTSHKRTKEQVLRAFDRAIATPKNLTFWERRIHLKAQSLHHHCVVAFDKT